MITRFGRSTRNKRNRFVYSSVFDPVRIFLFHPSNLIYSCLLIKVAKKRQKEKTFFTYTNGECTRLKSKPFFKNRSRHPYVDGRGERRRKIMTCIKTKLRFERLWYQTQTGILGTNSKRVRAIRFWSTLVF